MILTEIITIILAMLKITGAINVSWLVVFIPEMVIAMAVYAALMGVLTNRFIKKRKGDK